MKATKDPKARQKSARALFVEACADLARRRAKSVPVETAEKKAQRARNVEALVRALKRERRAV